MSQDVIANASTPSVTNINGETSGNCAGCVPAPRKGMLPQGFRVR